MKRKKRTERPNAYASHLTKKSKKNIKTANVSADTLPPLCFSDRFDEKYLSFLLKTLDLKSLIKSAVSEKKTDEGKEIKNITFHFCGIAASTLLSSDLNQDELSKKASDLRWKIKNAFSKIFERETLQRLNKQGIFVKVRFCFTYPYSDLPICLMKAETHDIWKHIIDNPDKDFYKSKSVETHQFEASGIYVSQQHSLRTIVEIIEQKNRDIINFDSANNAGNKMLIRFNVIPTSVCGLIINEKIAFADPYLYSKLLAKTQLALDYPVNVLHYIRDKDAFNSLQKHFTYLWRHDLTLYCGDATFYTPKQYGRLVEIRTPDEVIAVNWKQKEQAIRKSMAASGKSINEDGVKRWRENLNHKFGLCTRKLEDTIVVTETARPGEENKPDIPDTSNVFITIDKEGNNYKYEVDFRDEGIICGKSYHKANLLFCTLAHYCYAKKRTDLIPPPPPVLHEIISNKSKLETQLINCLNNWNNTGKKIDHKLLRKFFSELPQFELLIPKENISFNLQKKDEINEAKYTAVEGENTYKRNCLDYRK